MTAPVAPRPAATVIVLRAQASGAAEVLLLRRAQSASFFPHAWVFPGGRVEDEDALLPVIGGGRLAAPPWRAPAVAALRECFEESGVWLGAGAPGPALRARLNARQGSLLEGDGLVADLDRLRPWAWWITPPEEPKRFDTRFFVAVVSSDAVAAADAAETVDHRWLRPAEALADRGVGLAPPTFRTLEELAALDTVAAIWAAAADRPTPPIQPRLDRGEDGVIITLPGHPSLPAAEPAPGPKRICWRIDRWVSEDSA
jgi:8-oxo-dGTP pyrophosphatase MutT (NUDIX family)